jgi:hypothetical protein
MFWFEPINQIRSLAATSGPAKDNTLPIKIIKAPAMDTPQDQEIQRSWHEFNSGMRMLEKHRQRINASTDKIACANLRLLHNNLRSSAKYKSVLSLLKQDQKNHSLFYHWPLSTGNSMGCSIIGIHKQTRNDANIKQLLSDFVLRYFNGDKTDFNLTSATCMYLVMSGKLLVSRHTTEIPSTRNSNLRKTYSIHSYKAGDVLMIPGVDVKNIIDIRATQKHTQLFGIYMADDR